MSASSLIVPSAGLSPAVVAVRHGAECRPCASGSPSSPPAADRRGCCRRSSGRRHAASRRRLAAWRARQPAAWQWVGSSPWAMSPAVSRRLRGRLALVHGGQQVCRGSIVRLSATRQCDAVRPARVLRCHRSRSFLERCSRYLTMPHGDTAQSPVLPAEQRPCPRIVSVRDGEVTRHMAFCRDRAPGTASPRRRGSGRPEFLRNAGCRRDEDRAKPSAAAPRRTG